MASQRSEPGPTNRSPVQEAAFALPRSLHSYTGTGRATLMGRQDAPLVVMIGGISADRFPCARPDAGPGWWSGLAGAGKLIDTDRYRVLSFEYVADETGSRAPSPGDQAAVLAAAMDAFGAERAHALIGASYGGMIGLSFAEEYPRRLDKLVVISADIRPHPMSTACRELQRRVVRLGLDAGRGDDALAIARGMAMLTYRCPDEFSQRFQGGIPGDDSLTCSEPGAYLRARGAAFRSVMSPERFLSLSASIDRHLCRPDRIRTPSILIGALSDQLVPPQQMKELADRLGGPVRLELVPSVYGHDMFLKETDALAALLESAL